MAGRMEAVWAWVGGRHWWWVLPLLALGLFAPGVGSGWMTDDHWHRAALTADPELPELHRTPSELFDFTGRDTSRVQRYIAEGLLPWWADPELKLSFSRPMSGLTHAVDYRLWPDSPLRMHLHSLLWYLTLVMAVLALYRRLIPGPALAGLAALLFAVDDGLAMPTLWLANRNALVGALLGVLTLLLYDRWRRDGWRPGALLAPLALLGAVLGNEGAVAVGGYLVAYALFLDPAQLRRRITALLPCATVGFGWAVWYRASGFGTSGSGLYINPEVGVPFLKALAVRVPLLLWGQWAWPGAELSMILSGTGQLVMWGMGVALAGILVAVLLPLLRRRAEARFFALGMVGSLVPVASTFPSNRLLIFAGIGGMGLVAMLLAHLWEVSRDRTGGSPLRCRLALGGVAVLVLVHGVLSPLSVHPTIASMAQLDATVQSAAASLPSDAVVEEQDVVVVFTSSSFVSLLAAVVQAGQDAPHPRRILQLSAGLHGATIRRPDHSTLVVTPRGGYLRPSRVALEGVPNPLIDLQQGLGELELLFRDAVARPFFEGERIASAGIVAEVLSVRDGRPWDVAFHFGGLLESNEWRFVFRSHGPYQPFPLPVVGGQVVLE